MNGTTESEGEENLQLLCLLPIVVAQAGQLRVIRKAGKWPRYYFDSVLSEFAGKKLGDEVTPA